MENFYIEPTKYTPEIKAELERGEVKIYGSSYPENANEFYRPLTEWIDDYFASEKTDLTVNFYIYYFNTSTSKSFLNILEILEKYALEGKNIEVNWYYTTEDEDSLDSGERLLMDLELNYKLIPVSEI